MKKEIIILPFLLTSFNVMGADYVQPKTVVAVVDTGVDINHRDLQNKIYINYAEVLGEKNKDDDKNGYRDDFNGWNFVDWDNQLIDDSYKQFFDSYNDSLIKKQSFFSYAHGTHVAGIIAQSDNLYILPIKYVVPRVKGMKKRIYHDNEQLMNSIVINYERESKRNIKDFEMILKYAQDANCRIVNASYGACVEELRDRFKAEYPDLSKEEALIVANRIISYRNKLESAALKKFPEILFVVAAGNSRSNLDQFHASPVSAFADNMITVGAATRFNTPAKFSNYGVFSVDVFAPGENIRSTVPSLHEDDYAYMTGTSQATPHVSRLAGDILNAHPNFTAVEVKEIIMNSVDYVTELSNKAVTGGVINPKRALKMADYYAQGLSMQNAALKAR